MKKFISTIILFPLVAFAQPKGDEISVGSGLSIGPERYYASGLEFGYTHPWLNHTAWMLSLSNTHGTISLPSPTTSEIDASRTTLAFGCKVHQEFASILSAGVYLQAGVTAILKHSHNIAPLVNGVGTIVEASSIPVSPILRGGVILDVVLTDALTLGLTADCSALMWYERSNLHNNPFSSKLFSKERLSCTLGVKMGWHF